RDSQTGKVRKPDARPATSANASGGGCCSSLSVHSHTLSNCSLPPAMRPFAHALNQPILEDFAFQSLRASFPPLFHFLPYLLFDCLRPCLPKSFSERRLRSSTYPVRDAGLLCWY